jgi:hypothetical protein
VANDVTVKLLKIGDVLMYKVARVPVTV